ncbi:hypothetical protein LPB140_03065 [Sphingorhabdus lutea]|uniref:diguanylate cyclase n=1 Tax=Sphingorhabdus lutea TaxID=1913578 RepID=A0A1L3JA19_9SPHN|nr:GGDEF domain-containing protein [Sphingorhabdus lutea]APG61971.1 hypothetical protein LPB140_03065 [Sphingorhabdus lutea]
MKHYAITNGQDNITDKNDGVAELAHRDYMVETALTKQFLQREYIAILVSIFAVSFIIILAWNSEKWALLSAIATIRFISMGLNFTLSNICITQIKNNKLTKNSIRNLSIGCGIASASWISFLYCLDFSNAMNFSEAVILFIVLISVSMFVITAATCRVAVNNIILFAIIAAAPSIYTHLDLIGYRMVAGLALLFIILFIYARKIEAQARANIELQMDNQILSNNLLIANTELKNLLVERGKQALIDQQTGLNNRRSIFEKLENWYNGCIGDGRKIWLALIDLDHFKRVNDDYGHAKGDDLLAEVSQILKATKGNHLSARWGGEEFLLLIDARDKNEAFVKLEKTRLLIEEIGSTPKWAMLNGVTASIGAARLSDIGKFSEILEHADHALYEAKNNGRNMLKFYG